LWLTYINVFQQISVLQTTKQTIYTAGRPPWYNQHGELKEAFVIGEIKYIFQNECAVCVIRCKSKKIYFVGLQVFFVIYFIQHNSLLQFVWTLTD